MVLLPLCLAANRFERVGVRRLRPPGSLRAVHGLDLSPRAGGVGLRPSVAWTSCLLFAVGRCMKIGMRKKQQLSIVHPRLCSAVSAESEVSRYLSEGRPGHLLSG